MKPLANTTVVGASPSTLLPLNTRVRILHDVESITIIRCPLFGSDEVALRYSVRQLILARRRHAQTQPVTFGPLLSTIQVWRNTEKYGFFDGIAATNLQNASPTVQTVSVLDIGFHVPDAEFELPMLSLIARRGGHMSLDDTAAYLQSLILKQRRSRG